MVSERGRSSGDGFSWRKSGMLVYTHVRQYVVVCVLWRKSRWSILDSPVMLVIAVKRGLVRRC